MASLTDAQLPSTDEPAPDPMSLEMPPMLLGTYTPKIDAKGRVALPAKMRAQLGRGMVMARGQERCVFLSGAVDQDPDKQGRVLIPQMLRDYAGLGDEIVIIGVGTRAEIWNKQAWEDYLTAHEQGYADITSDVLPELEW